MIAPEILNILCCPETHQPLSVADPALIEKLNQQTVAGNLQNRGGQAVKEKLGDGLVRADGKYLYPIRGGIPIMLIDEAIPLNK